MDKDTTPDSHDMRRLVALLWDARERECALREELYRLRESRLHKIDVMQLGFALGGTFSILTFYVVGLLR